MKYLIYILIISSIFLFSCSVKKEIVNAETIYQMKIDSTVKEIIYEKDFPYEKLVYYAKSKDSIGFGNELAPLIKKVYYPQFDLTFEYRRSYEDHEIYEIIICYDTKNYVGIPFYWQQINGNVKLDLFENKLNYASNLFYNSETISKNYGTLKYFQQELTNLIIQDISLYQIRKIFELDKKYIIIRTENLVNSEIVKYRNPICKEKAIENIQVIMNNDENTDLYDFPLNDCQIQIKYTENRIEIDEINNCCFYETTW